jgi:protein SCO1/2
MPSRRQAVFALSVLMVALIVGFGALWFTRGGVEPVSSGTALIGGPFELTDQTGKRVTGQDFRGKYMLVFFGYTFCPDVCPGTLQVVSAALDRLGPAGDAIVPIFITVDPARDTPEVMRDYAKAFHPRLVALTGSEADIDKAARAYRVYYAKVKGSGNDKDYLMDHAAFLYLMDKDGKFLKHFVAGTNPDELANGLKEAIGS